MASVKFPHKVKVNGVYYAPGTVIEVEDPADYIKQGAIEVSKKTGARASKPSSSRKSTTQKEQ